jgi:hypothetical protein
MSKAKKAIFKLSLLSLLATFFTLQSCTRDMCEVSMTYTKYTPVYTSYDALRAPDAVKSEAPKSLENPGKIYVKDNYLFVNEFRKGIHIFDNSNPSSPVAVAFLSIPGNKDLAVYGDILYADSHVDIVAIDISNPLSPVLMAREENALPYDYYENYCVLDPAQGVVNTWKEEEITEVALVDCQNAGSMGPDQQFLGELQAFGGSGATGGGNKNPMTAGKGGSMARFTIYDRYLYAVSENDMHIFDIGGGGLTHYTNVSLGFGVETVFPYENMLFVGTTTGMQIFNNSNPANPYLIGNFEHVTSCDPVVVEGKTAFVSLRGGTPCGFNADQVHVVDITTPSNPVLTASYDMDEPYGLGIDNGTLFVCDGPSGLKIYNATNPNSLQSIGSLMQAVKTYDVIPFNNILYVIAEDGLSQFNYSNPASPTFLSRIPVVH